MVNALIRDMQCDVLYIHSHRRRDENTGLEGEEEDPRSSTKKALPCEDNGSMLSIIGPFTKTKKIPTLEGCQSRSRIKCDKCNVYLCLNKDQNCFFKFHCK